MNHATIAENFSNGATSGKGFNMYIENDKMFSYGSHYVLAKRFNDGVFLLNGDRYSVSTSKHQSHTRRACYGPTTSFTALQNAGIDIDDMQIIAHSDDKLDTLHNCNPESIKAFRNTIPMGATISYQKDKETGKIEQISYHLAGSSLIKANDSHYICGMDEMSYFVSQLPHGCHSVEAAYQMLKPKLIRTIETENPETIVQRQGEWFFYPVPKGAIKQHAIKKKDFNKNIALPTTDSQSNLHTVTRILPVMSNDKDLFYCFGTVRHPQHKMLKLGNVIHLAICNTAVNNWSVDGVD